jgi:hypothetical protein
MIEKICAKICLTPKLRVRGSGWKVKNNLRMGRIRVVPESVVSSPNSKISAGFESYLCHLMGTGCRFNNGAHGRRLTIVFGKQ